MLNWLKKLFNRNTKAEKLIIQILEDGEWETIDGLDRVKKSQVFRMIDPQNGRPTTIENSCVWQAVNDGRIGKDGIGEIEAEEL